MKRVPFVRAVSRANNIIYLTTLTEAQREVNPPCNENAVKVAMCNDDNIAGAFAFLMPLPVVFLDLWVMPQ